MALKSPRTNRSRVEVAKSRLGASYPVAKRTERPFYTPPLFAESVLRKVRGPAPRKASVERAWQKLLYLNAAAPLRPLIELPVLRDVEKDWLRLSAIGAGDTDEASFDWIGRSLAYYAPVSKPCAARLREMKEGATR